MRLYRYPLQITGVQLIPMRAGAVPLHVAAVPIDDYPGWRIDLWCAIDPEALEVEHRFLVIGTGDDSGLRPDQHIGSVITQHGSNRGVWHVFDGGEH